MSIHKLTAGSGYDYLTRQVARHDATQTGRTGLADYYTAQGEAPGVWVGSGLAGIEGLEAGDPVTAEQMRRLFGAGMHPLGDALAGQPGVTATELDGVGRLGRPYPVYEGDDVGPFRLQVTERFRAFNHAQGLPDDHAIPADARARIRTDTACDLFRQEHGRDPADEREVAATIAKHTRATSTAVAGYDLTFSPVKSVSTLWAVADRATSAEIEAAHQAAVRDALTFIETHALFTRTGRGGVQQVDVTGLVATAFTHRDSRAGDPDLHTHVAVANKAQTLDGRWLSIDGRVLFKATVTASETYNTALETHLRPLGLAFAERPGTDPRKRPVREVVGVDPRLNQRWSSRRASIETRRSELSAQFQATHGRPPTPVEAIQLAQQATLETRDAKHEPRSLAQQRATWRAEALHVLDGHEQLAAMISAARSGVATASPQTRVSERWLRDTATQILATVEGTRSTWQVWHVRAEAQRRVRGVDVSAAGVRHVVAALTTETLRRSTTLTLPTGDGISEPAPLRRRDGASVYTVAGAALHTSARIVQAERSLVAAAGRRDGRTASPAAVDLALLECTANGVQLNAGQVALVRQMATSGARVQLAIAPAGAGKTTAMRTLAAAWEESGGRILGLAPSAAAAAALGEQTGTTTDTLAKLTWALTHTPDALPGWAHTIGPDTLVLIDEAGMADTLSLDTAVRFITDRGASVRLIGDDQQLAAIGAGGVLRDITATHGVLHLSQLMRFADPAEGAASLALREGKTEALGFYLDHGRVHVGDLTTITEDVFSAWAADRARGLDAIMLAPTRDLVAQLNHRACTHRLEGADQTGPALRLADGNEASAGDLVITRTNDRRLRTSTTDWVKNGDRWRLLHVPGDGALHVQHTRNSRRVTLPADYVTTSTELGYATTVHTAQGVSADTTHALATGAESRQQLYTMLTRGRHANHVYLEVVGDGDPHNLVRPEAVHPPTATDLLENVLARDDSPVSATSTLREQADPAALLGQATARYVDALSTAAEHHLGSGALARLNSIADRLDPRLADAPAWPTLRAHLSLLAAHGLSPVQALHQAATSRELDTADDPAAVLGWRLDDTGLRNAGPGPLPWVPAVPPALAADPQWGPYLSRRADLVRDLAGHVARQAATGPEPTWITRGTSRPTDEVLAQVVVWRAARQIAADDHRPTGPPCQDKAPALYQRGLRTQMAGDRPPALAEWGAVIHALSSAARGDRFAPALAERLAAVSRAGLDAAALLRRAAVAGPLPDDHAAAALWWRVSASLSRTVAVQVDEPQNLTGQWVPHLVALVGQDQARAMQADPCWPALLASVDHARQRGWSLQDLLGTGPTAGRDASATQELLWRITLLSDPPPAEENREPPPWARPPVDRWHGQDAPPGAPTLAEVTAYDRVREAVHEVGSTPQQRWAPLADRLDPRLTGQEDWPMLARVLRELHNDGRDIPALVRDQIAAKPLGPQPAVDLIDRLFPLLPPVYHRPAQPRSRSALEREQSHPWAAPKAPGYGPER